MGPRFLIVRQDRLGDVVTSTPLPREIKRVWPDARVTVLARARYEAVLRHNPHVDEILPSEEVFGEGLRAFWIGVRRLRAGRYTHALMLLPWSRSGWMTFFAGIPVRVGVGYALHHVLTGVKVVRRRMNMVHQHECDHALAFLKRLGVEPVDDTPEVHLAAAERDRAAVLRHAWLDGRDRLVGLHVGSGGSAPNWTPDDYVDLARRLTADPRLRVIVTDPEPPPEILAVPGVVRIADGASLRDDIVAFTALDVMVSSSTGPMHLCTALGVPTVTLFCPLPSCAPSLWGPRGNGGRVVLPAPGYCAQHCPGDPHDCTYADDGLPASQVAAVTADVLSLA